MHGCPSRLLLSTLVDSFDVIYHSVDALSPLFQSKYAEAEVLYTRAANICEESLGPEDPNTAAVLNNWGELLYSKVKSERMLLK